ncbi:GLPGLI family protein [Chryseobacterium sp.]|uniref:GLPGLI family protein n=1 Tax=Chryseobacterium sp. TaxID=1871047 RepID=UPI00289A7DAE|nr:GLPGLI family protein [Chryseobacterium sp.]
MKNYILILLTISSFISAQQNYVFTYRMDAKLSTTQDYKTTEDFYLFSSKTGSFFISEKFNTRDSIAQDIANKGFESLNLSKIPKAQFKFIVEKNYANKMVNFYDNILNYKFVYEETPIFEWSISNEKLKIGEFSCTKATMTHYGRDWVAWFTEEIPLQDGPYKFSQLPGLIVRINDTQDHFKFDLFSIKKIEHKDFSEKKKLLSYKKITKKEYLESMQNINKNIVKEASDIGITLDEETQKRLSKKRKSDRNKLELIP